MEEIIKEIVDSIWEFIKGIGSLVFIIFIFSLLMFLVLTGAYLAIKAFDWLILGGVFFG